MIVTCPDCKKTYNDAMCWTLCPHNSLDVGPDMPYCRKHDLYDCKACEAITKRKAELSTSKLPLSRLSFCVADEVETIEMFVYVLCTCWPEFWSFVKESVRAGRPTTQANLNFGMALKRNAARTNRPVIGEFADSILEEHGEA